MANEKKQEQTISFHNTPSFYLEYTKNWLAHQRKAKANPAELAIVEDLHKLVEIALNIDTLQGISFGILPDRYLSPAPREQK